MRLRLREHRRGISWPEAFVAAALTVAMVLAIEVVTGEPLASVLDAVLVAILLVALRLLSNRDPV